MADVHVGDPWPLVACHSLSIQIHLYPIDVFESPWIEIDVFYQYEMRSPYELRVLEKKNC